MSLPDLFDNLKTILPITILLAWGVALLLADAWIPKGRKGLTAFLAAAGLCVALGFSLAQAGRVLIGFGGMVVVDGFAVFLDVIFLGSGLVGIALSYDYLKRMDIERGEYYVLLLFSVAGMMLMSVAADLIMVFLSLELLSIPLYVLAGFALPRLDSEEAALKYFLLGAFSGGIVVYGVALVFGAAGTTALAGIGLAARSGAANAALLALGAGLVLVGLGFKLAVVPFHMWTPDVYHGAPSAVTAFMSVGAKAAGVAALLRVFVTAFPSLSTQITPVLWGLAAVTMILGNVAAIAQTNIKRMLAYSSIAHAGYLLMAVVIFGQTRLAPLAVAASLVYLTAYALANFGAWGVVMAVEQADGQGLDVENYAGLGRRHPLLAAAMTIFMLSLTGVPPALGFVGKFYLFRAAIEGGFIGLALIGVLTSLVSAYYYLRVVVVMYMREGEPQMHGDSWLELTTASAAAATLLLTVASPLLFAWAAGAVMKVF